MSLIHKFIEDTETPEPVKNLYLRFVSEFDKQDSVAWNKQVKQTTDDYHRKELLKQGRCNFDKPKLNLTSAELIILYNYYYFPMHFQSSYEIYNKLFEEHQEFNNKTIFFHDIGCGTLSSTMAFSAIFAKYNLSSEVHQTERKYNNFDVFRHLHFYIQEDQWKSKSIELGAIRNANDISEFYLPNLINGYYISDISTSIMSFLEGFLKESFYISSDWDQNIFFNTASCTDGHFIFQNVADKFFLGNFVYNQIEPFKSFCNSQHKETKDIVVILNFSYVFASESIEIESVNSIINEYLETGCKLIIVNQNPDLDSLNKKWQQLKDNLKFVKSVNGLQLIKHFPTKSRSRYEVVFPTTTEIYFKQLNALYKEDNFHLLERKLHDFFNSNLFDLFDYLALKDEIKEQKLYGWYNFISDIESAFYHRDQNSYFHEKAHFYERINSLNTAKYFFEKEINEGENKMRNCYKNFMNKHFPDSVYLDIDDDKLPF